MNLTGKTLSSDWSVNSFLMVVYENFLFLIRSEFSVQNTTQKKNFSQTPILNNLRISQKCVLFLQGDAWGSKSAGMTGSCECAYVVLYDSLFHIIIHKTLDNLVKRKCTIRQDHKSEDLRHFQCNLGIRDQMNGISQKLWSKRFRKHMAKMGKSTLATEGTELISE